MGGKIAEIDRRVGTDGFIGAINSILGERGIHVNAVMGEQTRDALSQKPSIVIATHPDIGVDPLAIVGALPQERGDVSVIASELFPRMGENISSHIIPISGVAEQPTNNRAIALARKGMKGYLKLDSNRSSGEIGRDNVTSLASAKDRLNEGGLVVIFPEGAGGRDSDWQNGVGDMVVRSNNQISMLSLQEQNQMQNGAIAHGF